MNNFNYEFRALGSYKDNLFKLLLQHELSDLLIDILMPTIEDDRFDKIENFLGGSYEYYQNGHLELIDLKQHIFDVPFIYQTITDTRNAICIDTSLKSCTQTIKEMNIEISVICHKESINLDLDTRLKYKKLGYIGRNRLDIAVEIIGDIINGSKKFGIGKLLPRSYDPVKSSYPSKDFFGKILFYSCSDFMKNYTVI